MIVYTDSCLVRKTLATLCVAVLSGCGLAAQAVTSEWAAAVSGIWTNPTCWTGGLVPTNTSSGTNDVSVNVSGTYTSQWMNNVHRIDVGALDVGTTTGSGTQTVLISGYAYQTAAVDGPMTVGSRGVLDHQITLSAVPESNAISILVKSGGLYRASSTDSRAWKTGQNRLLVVEAGGRVEILPGAGLYLSQAAPGSYAFTSTNNGVITGAGQITVGGGSSQLRLAGSGVVEGPGSCVIPSNGQLALGGTLTLGRNVIHTDASMGPFYLFDGANITMNGNLLCTNAGGVFFNASDCAAMMGGSGTIDYTFSSATSYVGGYPYNGRRGTNTLYGSGQMILRTMGNVVENHFTLFVLARACYVNDNGGSFRVNGGSSMIISNSTGVLTMAAGTRLLAGASDSSRLRIRSGGSIVLNGTVMEGYNSGADRYSFSFSDDNTPAGWTLSAGTTNTLVGLAANQTAWTRLGTNASVTVGAAAQLSVSNAVLHVVMTNSAQWGWSREGTLVIGSNVVMDALSTDHGNHVDVNSEPFSIKRLAFDTPNSTLTLTNSAGGTRRALYVQRLDLGAVPGGTLNLQGFSGAERLYYSTLSNPNNVTFVTPAEWIQVPAEGTMVIIM